MQRVRARRASRVLAATGAQPTAGGHGARTVSLGPHPRSANDPGLRRPRHAAHGRVVGAHHTDARKSRTRAATRRLALHQGAYCVSQVRSRAGFDLYKLRPAEIARTTFIPALFGAAANHQMIRPHHSQAIYDAYAGDKNLVSHGDIDHNDLRPQFFLDSVRCAARAALHAPRTHGEAMACMGDIVAWPCTCSSKLRQATEL